MSPTLYNEEKQRMRKAKKNYNFTGQLEKKGRKKELKKKQPNKTYCIPWIARDSMLLERARTEML